MSYPLGRAALQKLLTFKPRRGWYTKVIQDLIEKLSDYYSHRNEVVTGGLLSIGASVTAAILQADTTAAELKLNGQMKVLAAQSDSDLFDVAGDIGTPIFADGATAASISLATDETAYVTVIAVNSDGSGDVDDTDGGAALLVALVAGTATTYAAQTDYLTSQQIQDALEASSSLHELTSGWVHVADILWDENGGAPQATAAPNRNNVTRAA